MRLKSILVAGAIALAALSTAACGQSVEPGNAGVKIKTLGSGAGVQESALRSGWHFTGIGEKIVNYPTIQRTYSYTREADDRGSDNEEIVFTDRTGLPMTADVAATIRVNPTNAPSLYTKYRLSFDELLDGPIRNDVRSAIAEAAERRGVDELLAGGRQAVVAEALRDVRAKWSREGVEISQLEWIGTIRFPDVILQAIQSRTQADQQVLAARARVAVAEAQAQEKVAIAKGDAEAYALRSRELTPAILQQQAIAKWNGVLPQVASPSATPFITLR